MRPDISEFSYGYALTETLISTVPRRLKAAPVFPSLIEEGKTGGYDVELPFDGFPLFLQFKLADSMKRSSCIESKLGALHPPFFRMHLRPTKHSRQHPLLLALESSGAAVFYAAPYFSDTSELNKHYLSKTVATNSIFFRPSEIGPLPDDGDHHVAFARGKPAYLCSAEPRRIKDPGTETAGLVDELAEGYWRYARLGRDQESVQSWANRLIGLVRGERDHYSWYQQEALSGVEAMPPLRALTYTALTFFGCNVVLVAPADASGSAD